jgi:hypothetical protein
MDDDIPIATPTNIVLLVLVVSLPSPRVVARNRLDDDDDDVDDGINIDDNSPPYREWDASRRWRTIARTRSRYR